MLYGAFPGMPSRPFGIEGAVFEAAGKPSGWKDIFTIKYVPPVAENLSTSINYFDLDYVIEYQTF